VQVPLSNPSLEPGLAAAFRYTVTCEAGNAFRAAGRRLPASMLEEVAAHLYRLEGG
jgi:hypothetical protein